MFSLHTLYVLLRNQKSQTDKIQFNKKKFRIVAFIFFLKLLIRLRDINYYVTLAFALNLVVGFWLWEITHKFSRVFSISWAIFRNCQGETKEHMFLLCTFFWPFIIHAFCYFFFFFFRVSKFYDRFIICARLRHTEMILQQIIQRFITITIIIVFSILY